MRREIDDRWGIAIDLGTLALVALRQADEDQAVRLLRDSILMRQELGDQGGIAWCLERFADVASRQGGAGVERAAKLYGAAYSLRRSVDSGVDPLERSEHERHIAVVRAQIDPAKWDSAWAAGQAMPVQQAVAYATRY